MNQHIFGLRDGGWGTLRYEGETYDKTTKRQQQQKLQLKIGHFKEMAIIGFCSNGEVFTFTYMF